MRNDLISVIVPIYNVDRYLKRCVDSILKQTFENIEIILVDDGSTDECPAICDEYAKRDCRIKVIHKENGGLSDARNAGIEQAFGEYLSFVDSDDVIHPKFIEKLFDAIIQTNTLISVCLFNNFSDEAELNFGDSDKIPEKLSLEKALKYYCSLTPEKSTAFISSCTKLYNRGLFKTLRFPKGKIYEDAQISYKVLNHAETVAFVEEPLYGYYMRSDSIMGVKEKHSYKVVLDPYQNAILYFREKNKNDLASLFYPPLLMREIYRYWVAKVIKKDFVEAKEILSLYKNDCQFLNRKNAVLFWRFAFKIFAVVPQLYEMYRKLTPGMIGGR